ncbi:MAG: hypothetical protein WCT85_00740 [Parachlamydiales bacterium]|jgi:hypothetical protein
MDALNYNYSRFDALNFDINDIYGENQPVQNGTEVIPSSNTQQAIDNYETEEGLKAEKCTIIKALNDTPAIYKILIIAVIILIIVKRKVIFLNNNNG